MTDPDRSLPEPLRALHSIPFNYDDGEGIDYEPFDQLMAADETRVWIRAWTGNAELTGEEYRVFGQDGTGGYAAFWLAREGAPLVEQPIVFFGSEGEVGVVARDLADFMWLVAGGYGPLEAVSFPPVDESSRRKPVQAARELALGFGRPETSPFGVVTSAQAEHPTFVERIESLIR